jgi:hypothetical protein
MPKGEIPVPYIVALILAIIVIAVVAYMFFTQTGLFSGGSNEQQCNVKTVQYCLGWKNVDPIFSNAPAWTSTECPAPTASICKSLLGINPLSSGSPCQINSQCASNSCTGSPKVCA